MNEIEAWRWLAANRAMVCFDFDDEVRVDAGGKSRSRPTLLAAVEALKAALEHRPYPVPSGGAAGSSGGL